MERPTPYCCCPALTAAGLEQVLIFNLFLSRPPRFLCWLDILGAVGSVVGQIAALGRRSGNVGDFLDDVGKEIELLDVEDRLLEVAGGDALAVAQTGFFGRLVAQRDHEEFEGFVDDDRSYLETRKTIG